MTSYVWVFLFASVVVTAALPYNQPQVRSRRDLETPPVRSRRELETPPVRSRRDLEIPPVRSRRELETTPVHSRRELETPPVRSRRHIETPLVRSRRDLENPPVRNRRELENPPVRSRRDLETPPVRSRRDLETPPVRSRRDLGSPPVRSRRDLETPPVRSRRDLKIGHLLSDSVEDSIPPVRSRREAQPPVRSRRDVQPPVRSRRDVQPPVRSRRDVQPPMRSRRDVQPPVRSWRDVQPPVRSRRDVQPPVRSRRDVQTPVRSRRDVQPPVRSQRDVQKPENTHTQFLQLEAKYEDAYVADFEGLAAEFVKIQEQKNGKVAWYDLYASRPEMDDYQEYQVNVRVGEARWEDPTMEYEFPGYTYTQSYENYGSQPIESVFSKTADVSNYYSWTLNKGVNVKTGFNFSIGIPPIFDISLDLEAEFYVDVTRTATEIETETYSVSHTVVVPPGKGVKAEFIVEDKAMSVPWISDVIIDGYIAIWYEEQVDEHWLWFYPVYLLANDEFVEYEDGVKVEAGGYFLGSKGVDDYINLEEYSLELSEEDAQPKKSKERPAVKHGV